MPTSDLIIIGGRVMKNWEVKQKQTWNLDDKQFSQFIFFNSFFALSSYETYIDLMTCNELYYSVKMSCPCNNSKKTAINVCLNVLRNQKWKPYESFLLTRLFKYVFQLADVTALISSKIYVYKNKQKNHFKRYLYNV